MNFKIVRLGSICRTTSGGTPSRNRSDYYGGDIPWVKSGELIDSHIYKTEEQITRKALSHSSAKVFPAGTLLIALYGATVGKLGILGIDAATNQAVCAIFTNGKIDRDYLFYYLLKQRDYLIESRTGGAQPNISQGTIRDIRIPVPPLAEQKRIAGLLARADRARRLRRTARAMGEGYLQSVFLEMFGDPVENPRGWPIKALAQIKTRFAYGTSAKCSYEPQGLPVLRIPNVLHRDIDIDDLKYAELPSKETDKLHLLSGDLLFVRTNGNPDYVGRCAVFDLQDRYLYASYLIRARLDAKVLNPWYAATFLRMPAGRQAMKPYIRTTAGQSNIGLEGLGQIPIPLPPLSLQDRFVHVVRKYERVLAQQQEAERQAEHLFQALLHRAFRGEV